MYFIQHQGVEFGSDGKEPVEALVAEFASRHLRADFDTDESRQAKDTLAKL